MVSGRRPSKTRGFLRFSNRPRNPARPSADFGLVDLRKLVVFCDFQIARATLCGLWAGRPSKTRGFLRFSNRPRDPLRTLGWSTFETSCFFRFSNRPRDPVRSLGWSTFETSWFFAIFNLPAQPSAEFRMVKSLSSWRGAHFLEAVNPKPLPSQGDLLQTALDVSSKRCQAIGIASDTFLKNFSLSAHVRAQLFALSFCYQTFYSKILLSKLFSRKSVIP